MKEGKGPSKDSLTRMIMRCPSLSELPDPPREKKGWPWTEETLKLPDTMPDGQPWPRVSIVTPSYNQEKFIEMTIRSVLLQGYPNLEYIIIDGGSTDNSVEIIKKYEKWFAYWVSEPDRGQSHAINKGFEKATGAIYSWINSDDYLLKDALSNVATAYNVHPEAGAWCGGGASVDVEGKVLGIILPKCLDVAGLADWNKNCFWQPACFFSADAWKKCGPLEDDLYYGMDFDLWLKIAKEYSFEKIDNVLAADRFHKDTKRFRDIGQMYAVQCLIQIRHGFELLAIKDIRKWATGYMESTGENRALMRIFGIKSGFPLFRPFKAIARIGCKKLLRP